LENSPAKLLVILTAPSGAGKTTIAAGLIKAMPVLRFSVSATTRAPRPGEQDGHDYYFMTVAAFEEKIAAGAFVEYEMVYRGKYYGTLSSELDRIWALGGIPLRVVDVAGALELKKKFGDEALCIFIQPPSLHVLEERLRERGTEDARTLQERVVKGHAEMQFATSCDDIVVNDRLEDAVAEASALISRFIRRRS
jgi:guanylate kinase